MCHRVNWTYMLRCCFSGTKCVLQRKCVWFWEIYHHTHVPVSPEWSALFWFTQTGSLQCYVHIDLHTSLAFVVCNIHVLSWIMDKTDFTHKFPAGRTLILHNSHTILTYALTCELFIDLPFGTMSRLSHSVARAFQAETVWSLTICQRIF